MDYNLNQSWPKRLKDINVFIKDEDFADAILTVCRILYSLKYEDIASKLNAGKTILDEVSDQEQSLINEAMQIFVNEKHLSNFDSNLQRAEEAIKFINNNIIASNKIYK